MSAAAAASYYRTVKYDTTALDMLINKAPSLMLDHKARGQLKSTLELLLRLKTGAGSYTETYKHSKNACGDFGRYYPQGCGMAFIHRPARGALVRNYYHDLDMINSLPVITVQFASQRYGKDLPMLRDYVARRPHYYDMIVRDLALKPIKKEDGTAESVEDQSKRIVNAIINGSAMPKATVPLKPALKFLRDLKAEMKAFADLVKADVEYADLWAWTKANEKSPASFCSKVVQREEAKVLVAMDAFLMSRGRVTASWIYDGLFVEKLEGETTLPADLIADCVAHVKAVCGYDIGLKVKAFESYPELDKWLEEWRAMDAAEKLRTSVLVTGSNTILPEFNVSHRYVGECLAAVGAPMLAGFNTLIINSHLGTGKTTEAVKMMRELNPDGSFKYRRILVISARKSFTRFIVGDLEREGLGFVAYDAPRPFFTPLSHENRVVVQVESLWKLDKDYEDYDFVVIDESETVLNQFYSLNTHKDNIRANHVMFERVVRAAKLVLYADAFVDQRTLLNATHLRDVAKIGYINNTFCPYERKATELFAIKEAEDEEGHETVKEVGVFAEFCRAIMADLKSGKRLVVIWTSLRKAEAFAETFLKDEDCPYKWRLYSSKSSAAQNRELENVEESWADLNLLMMTTSITVGINYNPEDESKIYDKLYLYACAKSALPRDIAQCLMRCRRIRSNELVYTIDRLVTTWLPAGYNEIRAAFLYRRTNNRTANPVINWTDSPKWVEDNFVLNERECALKSYSYVSILTNYLLRSGYKLEREEVELVKGDAVSASKVDATEVPIIAPWEAEQIRKAINSGLAEESERLALRRYNIYRNLSKECRAAEDGDIAEEIWVKCFESMEYEKVFWNMVGEKHTPTERFAEREAAGKYSEMVSKKVAKRVVLDKVLKILDMELSAEGKTAFEVTPEIVEAMSPLESDVYRAFSDNGKSRRKGDLAASHVIDMFNMIFVDWLGKDSGCSIVERKVKRIPKSTKQMIVFKVEIPAQPLWNHISEPRKEEVAPEAAALVEDVIELVN